MSHDENKWLNKLLAAPNEHAVPGYAAQWAQSAVVRQGMRHGPAATTLSSQDVDDLVDRMNDGSQALTR